MLLQKEKELCVCEIGAILGSIQPKISRHLALMRSSGLVLDDRRGQWVYYRINQDCESWMQNILTNVVEDFKNADPYRSDLEKLKEIRKNSLCQPG